MRFKFNKWEPFPLHIVQKYQVTTWPQLLPKVWQELGTIISQLQTENNSFKVHSLVLMNNHYHLLCSLKEKKHTLSELKQSFHKNIYSKITKEELTYDFWIDEIKSFPQYLEAYRYVYRNPIKAGLTSKAHLYPYSTLKFLLKDPGELNFSCLDNMNLHIDPFNTLRFIHNGNSNYYKREQNPQNQAFF